MEEKIRLLVVDDEKQFLETISKRLALRGFDVTLAVSGEAAIEEAGKKDFDVALIDLKMPGMDGEQVIRALKKVNEVIEVIILTGYGSVDSAIRTTDLGAYNYLQKPCEFDTLLHVIKEAYQKRMQNKPT